MDESEENMSSEDIKPDISLLGKPKPKKRSLVERELETNLTARVTSPITNAEALSTSRYGRARKLKTFPDVIDVEKLVPKVEKIEKTPIKVHSPVYRMHASNSPMRLESPKDTPNKIVQIEANLDNQIESIYHENMSLSRFSSDEKKITPNKIPKVYVRKDLIQTREQEETITLIKNLFSPTKSANKSNSHINNILERSTEKYELNMSQTKSQNGFSSVVKTLDFDSKKKRKENRDAKISKSELFEMETKCEYMVGDLAWSRMGTYPFWPCIVTREPMSGMFVKKKLFGRIERDMMHVTFFGDNGRRSWIVDTMLRNFNGQLEFEATRDQFTPADKKKDPRLYAAYFISEKKQPQWNIAVEEAELLLREPKRLRIDILNDMLLNGRALKTTPKQNRSGKITRTGTGKITRTASDVSLSESLYDTLFSEDDGKDDSDRSKNRSRNKSLDVSEVVTACLDNMAAKTGNIKIQRQSHMDRWLQKAKSKTPEKSQGRAQVQRLEQKELKVSSAKKKKKPLNNLPITQKPYSFRRSANESQNPMPNYVEHDYSTNFEFAPSLNSTLNDIENAGCDDILNIEELQSGIGVIAKVESLSDSANESLYNDEAEPSVKYIITEENIDNNEDPNDTAISEVIDEQVGQPNEIAEMEGYIGTEPKTSLQCSENDNNSPIVKDIITEENINNNEDPNDTAISEVIDEQVGQPIEIAEMEGSIGTEPKTSLQCSENDNNIPIVKDIITEENINNNEDPNDTAISEVIDEQVGQSIEIAEMEGSIGTEPKTSLQCSENDNNIPIVKDIITEENINNNEDPNDTAISKVIDKQVDQPIEIAEMEGSIGTETKTSLQCSENDNNIPINTQALKDNEIDQTSIEDNKVDKQLTENDSDVFITEKSVIDDSEHKLPNNLVNGDIGTHNMTEMSSKYSKLSDKSFESSQTMVSNMQERKTNDVFQPFSIEISKKTYTNPEFTKYLEMRQDSLMEEHPELSEDEIVEYLYQTWLYEEKSKCDTKKTDDLNQSNLVKGLKEIKPKSRKKLSLKTRQTKMYESIKIKEPVEEQIKLDDIKENTEIPETVVNSCNEIPDKIDISEELNTNNDTAIDKQDKAENEVKADLNKISTTYEQSDETTPNELDLKEMTQIKLSELNKLDVKSTVIPIKTQNVKLDDDMDASFNDNIFRKNEEDKDTIVPLCVTEDQIISNSKPIDVEVSEQTEVEITSTKEQNVKETEFQVSLVYDDETSNESIDISYAISPLSVKGDDELNNEDDIKIPEEFESNDESIQNSTLDKNFTLNGILDKPDSIFDTKKTTNNPDILEKELINDARPKENIVENKKTEQILEDRLEKELINDARPKENIVEIKKTEQIFEDRLEKELINDARPKENIVEITKTEQILEDRPNGEILVPKNKTEEQAVNGNELVEVAKINGNNVPKFIDDLDGDNLSIHSEDSEPLSVTKNKLILKQKERVNKFADPEFVTYLEMRQDDLADEHPELNQDEIVEYLYKTWLYEENSKSDIRKSDDIQQSTLIKGLGEPKPAPKKRKARETKEKKKEMNDVKENSNIETASIKSEESVSLKRWLRPKRITSKLYADFDSSRDTSPAITDETAETISLNSIDSEEYRTNNSTPNDELLKLDKRNKINRKLVLKIKPLQLNHKYVEVNKAHCDLQNSVSEVDFTKSSNSSVQEIVNGSKDIDIIENIKNEFDPDTTSIKSEESEVSLAKRKQKSKGDKTLNDPEFAKYLELRQDILIDENPQLTQEEIVSYLYKTWLYEESVKSDLKKSDEFEQSNLVKGINQDNVMPKKARKKIKEERDLDDEITKVKPKRKTVQPCYNEDYPDIEDEIAIFEILKNSPKVELNKIDIPQLQTKETVEQKEKEPTEEQSVIEIEDEVDEVELYFEELTKPKPNLFKGLIREKVCEICEKVDKLVKCKGCNGMFHLDCVKNETQVVEMEVSVPRGRKKKKKPGRRPKNLDDSGSMSDEKSHDVSTENMSVDEIIEPESRTVDAENFEAQLTAKMKELLESTEKEIHYDSYSSDDGVDWDNSVAGKCEIVDVILKPKSQSTDFKCNNCQKFEIPLCFVCKMAVSKTGVEYRQRCQVPHCHKYYHLECLDHWPQTQFASNESRNKKTNEVFESHMCPRHVCHTCVSDDPRGCKTRFSGDKLARCVRCPATYHSFMKCLPAGTQILTGSHIICPRHYQRPGKVPCHVNTGWCFICALGGTLICCEYCPTSFHTECLNISPPEGNYMCEDCETGRLPLYGEMVWVKLGHYRWWPGIILHPSEIPDNIMAVKHFPGEFVVRFFGQYDHYWVNRGRVFPFQEGDSGRISSQKSKIDAAFTTAMEHAQRAWQILKNAQENEEESLDIASSLLPPHYVKLKVNKPCGSLVNRRVDLEESSLTQCECDPNEPDPCGPYSQCLNRMLLTECGPICRAGDRCNNRAFEKRLYPKMVPYRTPHRGWGLKTLEDIKAGQFVIEYVGELIDEEEFKRRMARKHEIRDENFYFLTLDKERMIDAGPKGNLARFMNHCCEPNCETQKWTVLGDVRVGLFAIHDIPANSEVTFNYLLECASIDKKKCMCGAKRCAGYIGAKPKQDESQSKKGKVAAKRIYNKKRKNTEESPSTKTKQKRPVGRPTKPKELTEIEKDLLIIKNATNGLSSDSDCSRLSSVEGDKNSKALKRKRVSFSTEEVVLNGPVKKLKSDESVD